MCGQNERQALAEKLKGQKLTIPDMRPIFAHWPGGQNENYEVVKGVIEKELRSQPLDEDAIRGWNPALLAATWWPTAASKQYRVLTDLVIWFGVWDDVVEKLGSDQEAAEHMRSETKAVVRQTLLLGPTADGPVPNPLMTGFGSIAKEVCAVLDEEQRGRLVGHFNKYIDATQLEAEADQGTDIPSLEKYWEVRKLSSGMPILLGFSEYALQVKLPTSLVDSAQYQTLWEVAIVINSIVNDLISFKKEMKQGSILSSVAILYHRLDNLNAAVEASLGYLKELISEFDRTAEMVLDGFPVDSREFDVVSRSIDSMRMVNTGNLEWSLQVKRYGVLEGMTEKGQIEFIL
ncbi:putative terpene synthase family protein [Eutypa lata UCREL1]|uniref:Terpene synthase n=1 Tax=Eutypa lata (strain UCR-EL1) TaxID=1287681 RepID=M7SAE2_EUTLA|nr:putative terpene synthase family protein [Eutypa lata UCREL1]